MSRYEVRQRASWVLLAALVATAVTFAFVASNVQAQSTGPIDEELCTKIENGLIGVDDSYEVGTTGVFVTYDNWVSSNSDFIGFDWSSDSLPINVWVKFSTDTEHQSGTSGQFAGLPHGISNVIACLDSYESGNRGAD